MNPRARQPLLRKKRRKKSQKQKSQRREKHPSPNQHLNPKIRKALVVCRQNALFYERVVFAVN